MIHFLFLALLVGFAVRLAAGAAGEKPAARAVRS